MNLIDYYVIGVLIFFSIALINNLRNIGKHTEQSQEEKDDERKIGVFAAFIFIIIGIILLITEIKS